MKIQDRKHDEYVTQPEFGFVGEIGRRFVSVVRTLRVFTASGKHNEHVTYGQWLEFFTPLSGGNGGAL